MILVKTKVSTPCWTKVCNKLWFPVNNPTPNQIRNQVKENICVQIWNPVYEEVLNQLKEHKNDIS